MFLSETANQPQMDADKNRYEKDFFNFFDPTDRNIDR